MQLIKLALVAASLVSAMPEPRLHGLRSLHASNLGPGKDTGRHAARGIIYQRQDNSTAAPPADAAPADNSTAPADTTAPTDAAPADNSTAPAPVSAPADTPTDVSGGTTEVSEYYTEVFGIGLNVFASVMAEVEVTLGTFGLDLGIEAELFASLNATVWGVVVEFVDIVVSFPAIDIAFSVVAEVGLGLAKRDIISSIEGQFELVIQAGISEFEGSINVFLGLFSLPLSLATKIIGVYVSAVLGIEAGFLGAFGGVVPTGVVPTGVVPVARL